MLAYPIGVKRNPTGAYSVTFPDLPSVTATAWTINEAVEDAVLQARTTLTMLMLAGDALPEPSDTESEPALKLDTNESAKWRLYDALQKANLSRSELAALAHMDRTVIDDLLDLRSHSPIERIALALGAILTDEHGRARGEC